MKTLKHYFLFLAFVVASQVNAGTVAGFGGSTEITQLANNIQLAQSYIKQAEAYAMQLKQYQIMFEDNKQSMHAIYAPIEQELMGVARLVKQGQALAFSAQNIDQQFTNTFKGYQYNPKLNYSGEYRKWSGTTLDSIKGSLQAANLQSQQFSDEEKILRQLRTSLTGSTGQLAAIQAGGQIAEQQVQQLQKLRQLMMAQMQAQNTYMAAQENKEATMEAAREDAFTYRDPKKDYKYFKGGASDRKK